VLTKLFGSRVRANVLSWLLCHADERFFVRQLKPILGEDATHIGRELARLEKMGILTCTSAGREKYYQANAACPVYPELRGLALKTAGLADVLRDALAPLGTTVRLAFVYGSMASGEPGPGSDVDLMVVGEADELALHEAVSKAEEALGRPVNYTLLSEEEFRRRRREKGGFLDRVLDGPKLVIQGALDEPR
jgi:predicted nucleotidyltransferase